MKKRIISLVIFLGVLATFFVGTDACKGKDKDKDKSSSSNQTTSSTQDNSAAPPAKK